MGRTRLLSTLIAACLWGTLPTAHAQDVAAAANAFAQGQRAELAGQYGRAAEFYELADSIAPTPEALRAAVKARRAGGDLAGAASGAERLLLRYPHDAVSRELADDVLSSARESLARVSVTCEAPCGVVVDGYAAGTESRERHVLYLEPGAHEAYATFVEGRTEASPVEVQAGGEAKLAWGVADVQATEPAPEPMASEEPAPADAAEADTGEHPSRRIHPAPFYVALGTTVALGAVAIWSAVDTKNAADDFRNDPTPTQAEFDAGDKKDTRTNILFAASMVGVAATAVLGYFTFRSDESPESARRARVQVAADHTGAGLAVTGAF